MNQNFDLVQNGSVYKDYEPVEALVNWCTPKVAGCQICVDASATGGIVTLKLTLKTPVGDYTKTVNFNSNVCFEWAPGIPLISPSIKVCIKNFTTSPQVSFTLSVDLCVKVPIIGKKCATWSYVFRLPVKTEILERLEDIGREEMATLYLLLTAQLDDGNTQCQCH